MIFKYLKPTHFSLWSLILVFSFVYSSATFFSILVITMIAFHIYAFVSYKSSDLFLDQKQIRGQDPYDLNKTREKLGVSFLFFALPTKGLQSFAIGRNIFFTQELLDRLEKTELESILAYYALGLKDKTLLSVEFYITLALPFWNLSEALDNFIGWMLHKSGFCMLRKILRKLLIIKAMLFMSKKEMFKKDKLVFSEYKNWPDTLRNLEAAQGKVFFQDKFFFSPFYLVNPQSEKQMRLQPCVYKRVEELTGFRLV